MADARRAVASAIKIALLRGAGALVFLSACAGLVALATFSPDDASLSNATGAEPANWLGGLGATAADLLLADLRHWSARLSHAAGGVGRAGDDRTLRAPPPMARRGLAFGHGRRRRRPRFAAEARCVAGRNRRIAGPRDSPASRATRGKRVIRSGSAPRSRCCCCRSDCRSLSLRRD